MRPPVKCLEFEINVVAGVAMDRVTKEIGHAIRQQAMLKIFQREQLRGGKIAPGREIGKMAQASRTR
jgi:hypothetical protein